MTGKRPRLYPAHQHQWTDADPALFTGTLVRCTICGFTVPRTLANLDGKPAEGAPDMTDDLEGDGFGLDQPVTEWVPLGVASDEVTEETTTETEWGTETHRTYADGGSSLSVDAPVTDQGAKLTDDIDTRCGHVTDAGQCLNHRYHTGDHQQPQEPDHA